MYTLITVVSTQLKTPEQFVQDIWDYTLPSILAFSTAVISATVLLYFLKAGAGN